MYVGPTTIGPVIVTSNTIVWTFVLNQVGNYVFEVTNVPTSSQWLISSSNPVSAGAWLYSNSRVDFGGVNNSQATTTPLATARFIYITPCDQFGNQIPTASPSPVSLSSVTQDNPFVFPITCRFVGKTKTYSFTATEPPAASSPTPTAYVCAISGIVVADSYTVTINLNGTTTGVNYVININSNYPSGANCVASGFSDQPYMYAPTTLPLPSINVLVKDVYNNPVTGQAEQAAFIKNTRVTLSPLYNASIVGTFIPSSLVPYIVFDAGSQCGNHARFPDRLAYGHGRGAIEHLLSVTKYLHKWQCWRCRWHG